MNVGMTGHQDLGSEEDISWITSALADQIEKLKITYGNTSLAMGADQLFASMLRKRGINYSAIIPCLDYEETFDSEVLKSYRSLYKDANEIIQLPYSKPEEIAFWEAGKEVVKRSDIVIAVWDGEPAKGLGGTGDVVTFCLQEGKRVVHIHSGKQKISILNPKS